MDLLHLIHLDATNSPYADYHRVVVTILPSFSVRGLVGDREKRKIPGMIALHRSHRQLPSQEEPDTMP